MTILTKYISNLSYQKLDINLCNCMIDDNVLLKSSEYLQKCINIQKFNISLNTFTLHGFSVILELSTQDKSNLTELNISDNMISNLAAIGELVRKSRKLEILLA